MLNNVEYYILCTHHIIPIVFQCEMIGPHNINHNQCSSCILLLWFSVACVIIIMELNGPFIENNVHQGRQNSRKSQGRKGEIEEGRKGERKVSFSLVFVRLHVT